MPHENLIHTAIAYQQACEQWTAYSARFGARRSDARYMALFNRKELLYQQYEELARAAVR